MIVGLDLVGGGGSILTALLTFAAQQETLQRFPYWTTVTVFAARVRPV